MHPDKSEKELREMAGVGPGVSKEKLMKQVEGKLGDALASLGVTEQDVVRTIKECLSATKQTIIKSAKKDKDGNIVGYNLNTHESPDHQIRLKTVELLCKLGGYHPATKVQIDGKLNTTHVVLSEASMEKLMARERQQRAEIPAEYTVEDAAAS